MRVQRIDVLGAQALHRVLPVEVAHRHEVDEIPFGSPGFAVDERRSAEPDLPSTPQTWRQIGLISVTGTCW